MKDFDRRLSLKIDHALHKMERRRGLARLYWKLRLMMLEWEVFHG